MSPRRLAQSLVATLCLAASPALADDPYGEYRIPEHYWRSWTASLKAVGNHNRGSDYYRIEENGQLSGALNTSVVGGFDSDTRSSAYGLTLAGTGSRANHSLKLGSIIDDADHDRSTDQQATGFFAFSRYPHRVPIGLTLASNQFVSLDQSWASSRVSQLDFMPPPKETRSADDSNREDWRTTLTLSASLNWGRVRDATPVYQAQVLEQRLHDLGTIQGALSANARERLAALYTTEARLAFAHQRPTKYFWGELERLLREDGVLGAAGLDAYAVQRLLEPLTITGTAVARTRGFSVGPMVSLRSDQYHDSFGIVSSSAVYHGDTLISSSETTREASYYRRFDTIQSGVAVDYHRPFGPRWQVDGTSTVTLTESGKSLLASTTLQAVWLVTDRWYAATKVAHDLSAPHVEGHWLADLWTVNCSASLSYFLEDSWALQLGALHQQSNASGYDRSESFSLGVTYQFAGFLNAPGLFAPMRLSPPAN